MAKRTRTIHVRRWHIIEGQQESPNSCPVALAMREAGFDDACVYGGLEGITFTPKAGADEVTARSKTVTRFVRKFDNTNNRKDPDAAKRKLSPFSFILRWFT